MLQPAKDRHNYSKLLTPPAGYEVNFAIGTTYSLDLEALVGIPLALGLSEEMDGTFMDNPVMALEALRRSADKLMVFCEAGQIKVPQRSNNIFTLLEDSVFEVALENNNSFHPKIWVIKYTNKDEEVLYRFLILSRNLTFDRSWDIAVALEGKMESVKNTKNKPLIDFLIFLQDYSKGNAKREQLKSVINELGFVSFDPMDKRYPDFDFYPLGISNYSKAATDIFDTYHHLIVISPFISKSVITELNEKSLSNPDATKVLITRKTELHELTESILSEFKVYTLKDAVIDGESTISGENGGAEIAELQDIHAKLYARTKYNEHLFYIGSANSSFKAFNGNVEFLLKLKYKKRGFKISDLLQDLFGDDEKENPFEQVEEIPPEEEDADIELTNLLQNSIKKLCRTESRASVIKEDDRFNLQVYFEEIPSSIDFSISPLLSEVILPLQKEVQFENLSLLELGEFYEITATKEGKRVERIIKVETSGLPLERKNEIFRSIISDPHTFLMYVAFLLADDFLLSVLENWEKKDTSFDNWNTGLGDVPVLYENLLKATSRSPEKLYDIEEIIRLISNDEIIPKEFDHLYKTFLEAAKVVKK